MYDIYQVLDMPCKPEDLNYFLIYPENWTKWWAEEVIAKSDDGLSFQLRFANNASLSLKKDDIKDGLSIEFTGGHKDWIGTKIIISSEPKSPQELIVRFKHLGWREMTDYVGRCNHLWTFYLERLKKHVINHTKSFGSMS